MTSHRGLSLPELLTTLAVVAVAALMSVGLLGELATAGRTAAAAREMAITFAALRWRSVSVNRSHALAFERDTIGWHWYVVRDGNGNGVRTAEIRTGVDTRVSGPHRLEQRVAGVSFGFPPGGPFPRIPPRRGALRASDDPIDFGRSDLVSFSPLGTASSGTLYVTDGRHRLSGILLFGPTNRVRVWHFDTRVGRWKL
jgi:prepilin-type N-terminal cleavage/methylation domain-containing protein